MQQAEEDGENSSGPDDKVPSGGVGAGATVHDPGKAKALSNRWQQSLRGIRQTIMRAWPHDCFACGMRTRVGALCAGCAAGLPRTGADSCPVCANPSPGGQVCGFCLRRPPSFDASLAVFVYRYPVREMLLALKAGQGFGLLPLLQDAACERLAGLSVDAVLPVPLHPRRLAERGFNQSLEIARGITRQHGWPLWPAAILRDTDTPHQMGATLRERRRNVRGAFRCPAPLAGQHVLVVDDVMTSGATLGEVARTLKLAGAARVTNLVLARVVTPLR